MSRFLEAYRLGNFTIYGDKQDYTESDITTGQRTVLNILLGLFSRLVTLRLSVSIGGVIKSQWRVETFIAITPTMI